MSHLFIETNYEIEGVEAHYNYKMCYRCLKNYKNPDLHFYKKKKNKDGFDVYCKICSNNIKEISECTKHYTFNFKSTYYSELFSYDIRQNTACSPPKHIPTEQYLFEKRRKK